MAAQKYELPTSTIYCKRFEWRLSLPLNYSFIVVLCSPPSRITRHLVSRIEEDS